MIDKIDKIFNWFVAIENSNIFNFSLVISLILGLIGALLFKFNFFMIGSILILIPFIYLVLMLVFTIVIGILEFIVFMIKKYRVR